MPHLIAKRHVGVIAIGNALGNSFVANRTEAENEQLKQAAKPAEQPASAVDPDTGKFSPISESEAWSLERAVQNMAAREQEAQAIQAAQAAPASTPGWVNDGLLNYELGHYFDSVDEFNFTINEGLMADVDSSLLASALQRSNSPGPWMGGYGFPGDTNLPPAIGFQKSVATDFLQSASNLESYISSTYAGLELLKSQNAGIGFMARELPANSAANAIFSKLNMGQYSALSLGMDGKTFALADSWFPAIGDTTKMTTAYGFGDLLKNPAIGFLDDLAGWAGPVFSTGEAIDYAFWQKDSNNRSRAENWEDNKAGIMSHAVKAGADWGFLAWGLSGSPVGAVVGGVYTVTDAALSLTPQYTVRYGDAAGYKANGWEKAFFWQLDRTHVQIQKFVETGVGPRGVKLRPQTDLAQDNNTLTAPPKRRRL
uniref:Uncharacterized protein n=1 Tax=Rheinheimera sp. BAL341 TaxID=1708203 RepID=A0A486XSV2_9GAMM